VLAVVQESGPLTLYRLAPGSHTATRLRELAGPGPVAQVIDVSLSAGAEPTVCATWAPDPAANEDGLDFVSTLLCYAPGSRSGAEVAVSGDDDPVAVAVRPDGRALAWSTYAPEGNGRIDVGRLDGAAVSEVRGFLNDPDRPEGTGEQSFTGAAVGSLGWLDDDELAIGQENQSDDGSGLRRFTVAPGQKGGWGDADVVVPPATESEKGYTAYESVVGPAEDGTALAVERGYYLSDDAPAGARRPHRPHDREGPRGRGLSPRGEVRRLREREQAGRALRDSRRQRRGHRGLRALRREVPRRPCHRSPVGRPAGRRAALTRCTAGSKGGWTSASRTPPPVRRSPSP
jgi:hypothetical protein